MGSERTDECGGGNGGWLLKTAEAPKARRGLTVARNLAGLTWCTHGLSIDAQEELKVANLIADRPHIGGGGQLKRRHRCPEAVRAEQHPGPVVEEAGGWGIASRLDCGQVSVNVHAGAIRPDLPFSGHKWSGLGVENGPWGLHGFTDLEVLRRPAR